jgi:hypothetical protein
MKRLTLLFACCLISAIGSTQDNVLNILPLKDGKVNYSGVVNVDSVNKAELYNRAKHWLVETYNSAKDVIQIDDKENGEIMGKGYFEVYWTITFYAGQNVGIWNTLRIQAKDGRYRYEITDFHVKYTYTDKYRSNQVDQPLETWDQWRPGNLKKVLLQIDEKMQGMISSLKDYMEKPQNNNW